MPTQTCLIKVLNMDGQCNLGALGYRKWTALQRAAAFGTGEDVRLLTNMVLTPVSAQRG